MINLHPIESGEKLYGLLRPSVHCFVVKHEQLLAFHQALRTLEKKITDDVINDDYLLKPLKQFKRFRFEACAMPVDFNSTYFKRRYPLHDIKADLSRCPELYPSLYPAIKKVIDSFSEVIDNKYTNPLRSEVIRLCGSSKMESTAVLVSEPRFVRATQDSLRTALVSIKRPQVISPSDLTGHDAFDKIVVVGPPRWFPEYVLNSPRTPMFNFVSMSWLHDEWKPRSIFGDFEDVTGSPAGSPVSTKKELSPGCVSPLAIIPQLVSDKELQHIVNRLQSHVEERKDAEKIDLRLFLLEGGKGVFLEEIDNVKMRVVNIGGEPLVSSLLASEVNEGTFLLLRTQGGGDYITSLANQILGDEAEMRRSRQELWKLKLRHHISNAGILSLIKAVQGISEQAISAGQIRYWMWSGSIGPKNPKDFEALMTVLGLENMIMQCQEDIQRIRTAHIKAGHTISQQLIKLVSQTSMELLEDAGILEFKLDDSDKGEITAVRVLKRTDLIANLPAGRARQLFYIEEGEWQD